MSTDFRAALEEICADYGGIERRTPRDVLRPRSPEDIAALIAEARRKRFCVAARGRGHSVRGQALVEDGVVVDMRSLTKVDFCTENSVTIEAGADWQDLLNQTLPHGLWPPVLPNYLGLSIGGTLSVGGIGEATFRHGLIADAALSLDVVTGRSEILTCSADQHPELFAACKGGLGQFGIICRARLSLLPAPPLLRSFHLLYAEVEAFLQDFQRLAIDEPALSGLRGLAIPNRRDYLEFALGPAHWSVWISPQRFPCLFLLTATFAHDAPGDFLERLQYVPGALRTEELRGSDIAPATQVNRTLLHPWVDLFIPAREAPGFLREALTVLPMDDIGGPVLLYPIVPSRTGPSLCQLPADDFVVLLSVSRAISPSASDAAQQLAAALAQNRQVYESCYRTGGRCYPIGGLGLEASDWHDHFGSRWSGIEALKKRYDPDHILAPGQRMS